MVVLDRKCSYSVPMHLSYLFSPYSTTSTLWHMVGIFRGFNPSRIELYVPLAFSGCIENEFMRINLECDGAYVVPRNGPGMTKYP